MATLAELAQEFEGFSDSDLHNNRKLIGWLARAFDWACGQVPVELPGQHEFAARLGTVRKLLPELTLAGYPPTREAGDPALAGWLLACAINLLTDVPTAQSLEACYEYFIKCAKDYLGVRQSDPIPE